MRRHTRTALATLAILAVAACDLGGPGADVVAHAEEMELSVEEAATLLGSQSQIPAEDQVVRALADLWLDYSLLGLAVSEDSTLSHIDMSSLLRQREEQRMISSLRDSILAEVDTTVTDEELERVWREDAPGVRVRARHILLPVPEGASDAVRDSVRELAGSLAERARAGEDFAGLAREHSQDPSSAARGGDLGFFGQGEMVASFDEAAFSLDEGEISDPVQSPFGFHVILVEERQTPSLDSVRERFRQQVRARRILAAESTYVAALPSVETIEVREDGVEILREVTREADRDLTRRAASRTLVTYEGGEVTAREIREFLLNRPPAIRSQILQAPEERLVEFLRDLARTEILVEEARAAGYEAPPAERDSLGAEARQRIVEAARTLGLLSVTPDAGESLQQAIERQVEAYLEGVLTGGRDVIPLGGVSHALREEYDSGLNPTAVDSVVSRLSQAAQGGGAGTMPQMPQMPGSPGGGAGADTPGGAAPPTGGDPDGAGGPDAATPPEGEAQEGGSGA